MKKTAPGLQVLKRTCSTGSIDSSPICHDDHDHTSVKETAFHGEPVLQHIITMITTILQMEESALGIRPLT